MDIQTNTFIVDSPEFAKSMLNIDDWKRLALFMNETTLSEVADKLDISLSKLSYHVNKWLEYGILRIVREEKRAGRPVKIYKTTSERFFVPFHVTPSASLEELVLSMVQPVHEIAVREQVHVLRQMGEGWGMLWQKDDDGVSVSLNPYPTDENQDILELLESDDGPAAYQNFANLKLDHASAKALQKELIHLYKKYKEHQEGQPSYLLQVGLTPLRPGTKMA